ncbi:molybdenum cofactor guanylyltransferase [Corynebacterium sp. HMSC11E11]|uniref:molybdenum cofactor guanylyltransferase n=1 Tax=Corynebacterium sp. HMSC11E11 TaxID=1581089 RepID=UPI0008A1E18D|nr:NTP transferase domain-containing protein [Corynebacterium sp. HMSC11E11]
MPYDDHREAPAELPPSFAIVLAGGTGRRMDGASKPDVVVAGRRMIDHVLGELAAQSVPAVVVGPPDLAVPADVPTGVTLVREDPPFGGPAAGIAAGYDAGPLSSGTLVAILACDAPFAPRVLPDLVAAASNSGGPTSTGVGASDSARTKLTGDADSSAASVGAVAVTPDGRIQRLLCVVDSDALGAAIRRLENAGGVRDRSVRALLGGLPLTPVDVPAWATDADTPDDVIALERMSPDGRESPL